MDLVNMGCSLRRGGNRARSSSDLDNMGWIVHRSRKQGCGGNIARSSSAVRVGRRLRYDLKRQRNVTRVFEHDPTGGGALEIGDMDLVNMG